MIATIVTPAALAVLLGIFLGAGLVHGRRGGLTELLFTHLVAQARQTCSCGKPKRRRKGARRRTKRAKGS